MDKIPTAKELLREKYKLEGNEGVLRIDQLIYIMNDFAKLHVKAALQYASHQIDLNDIKECDYQKIILNAYPLDNIK